MRVSVLFNPGAGKSDRFATIAGEILDRFESHILFTGEGDWKAILSALKEIDYSGIYVLEPAYRHYQEDVEAKLRLARKSLDIFL